MQLLTAPMPKNRPATGSQTRQLRFASSQMRPFTGSRAKARKEVADFFLYFLRSGDGVGNFPAQDFAVTRAQPMDGHLYGRFREVQPDGDLGVRQGRLFPGEAALQIFE
jgi:hypothetical protein